MYRLGGGITAEMGTRVELAGESLDLGRGNVTRYDLREATALHQLSSLPATAGDFVLRGADRLFAAAGRLHGQQVPVAGRHDRADHLVFREIDLDQDDAASG